MRPFPQHGILAVRASSLAAGYAQAKPCGYRMVGETAVVEVHGPIDHHAGHFANYDEIKAAVAEAFASSATSVLLSIDSPGGLVSGCTDTAIELRAMSAAAGKPLYAYVDGTTVSAAYLGLACAAERIYVPPTGEVGHLGVIQVRVDVSAAQAASGVSEYYITSGKHKANGQPGRPMSEDEMVEGQAMVDEIARVMLGVAAEFRGKSVEELLALEARIFVGQSAIDIGLADELATFDQVLAAISAGSVGAVEVPKGSQMDKEEAIKALRAAAEDGDEEAKAMLAAMGGDEEKAEAPEEEEEKAEGDEEEPEEKKEESRAMKAIAALRAELAESKRAAAVSSLLASRPDIGKEMASLLRKESAAKVQAFLKATPVAASAAAGSVAAAKAPGHSPASVSPDQAGVVLDPAVAAVFGGEKYDLGVVKAHNSMKLWAVKGGK